LWFFYTDTQPKIFPEIPCKSNGSLSAVKLIKIVHKHLPESYLQSLEHLIDKYPMDLLLFSSDGLGTELASRLAHRLNGSSCLQVEGFNLISDKLEVRKPVYGNNLSATFVLEYPPYCVSCAKQPCAPAKMIQKESMEAGIFPLNLPEFNPLKFDWVKTIKRIPDQAASGLLGADLVLVVGQGVKNRETMNALQNIADTMGAQLGASRPVVMNALIDMNRLIGASGLIISPKLCIAAGVSGTGVFNMGIKSSEFIVAINIDTKAPIFQIADIGIVRDLQDILCELEKIIMAEKIKKGLTGLTESRDSAGSRIDIK
jgi:electron transfer flavoprotein alpha subunit